MIYRIILNVGYCERAFEFNTIEEAAAFAATILEHDVPEESDREMTIRIDVVREEVECEK